MQFLLLNYVVLSLFFTGIKGILNAIVVELLSLCLTPSKPHGCSPASVHGISQARRLVQFSSVTQLCPTLCDPMDWNTPGLSVHHQLLEFAQTHVLWVGDAIQPSHPLSSPSPISIFLSIRVFSKESVLHVRWPKYWSFSFSISPFNEYSELISLRVDWLDLLAVQVTLKSLLQHHSSKASIFWCSAFFTVQLSHP